MLTVKDSEPIDRLLETAGKFLSLGRPADNNSRSAPVHYEAFDRLEQCADRFYAKTRGVGTGANRGWPEVLFRDDREPELSPDTILQLPARDGVEFDEDLKKLLLFSDFLVIVLPYTLYSSCISYSSSASRGLDLEAVERCAKINSRYASCIRTHNAIFLPRCVKFYSETMSDSHLLTYDAPLRQSTDVMPYVPYNTSIVPMQVLTGLSLPFFSGLALDDLIKIKQNESPSFSRFQHFLQKKLKSLGESKSPSGIQDIVSEIEDEVRRLNFEAVKLTNLRVMRGVTLGAFGIALGAMFMPQSEILKDVAGIMGSASLVQLFTQYFDRRSKVLDLKKDTFYIPYLLAKHI